MTHIPLTKKLFALIKYTQALLGHTIGTYTHNKSLVQILRSKYRPSQIICDLFFEEIVHFGKYRFLNVS